MAYNGRALTTPLNRTHKSLPLEELHSRWRGVVAT